MRDTAEPPHTHSVVCVNKELETVTDQYTSVYSLSAGVGFVCYIGDHEHKTTSFIIV